MSFLTDMLGILAEHFTRFGFRTYWVFLLSSLVLATVVYMRSSGSAWSLSGAVRFLFPKNVWLHKSSLVDYRYFAVNAIFMLLFITPMLAVVYPAVANWMMVQMASLGMPQMTSPPAAAYIAYFVVLILVTDFLIFFGHYISHKSPFLWQFHKVHHSAEVLNPMTLYRQHPVDLFMTGCLVGGGTALIHGLFCHLFSTPFTLATAGGLTAVSLLFYLFGYNLRHSHVRLSFGRLDRWLISPEQHQLHHSRVPAHFDKDFGLIFAVWDRLFRTHYLPAKDEEIILGLPNDEHLEFNRGVIACYILPFRKAIRTNAVMVGASLLAVLGVGSAVAAQSRFTPPSVHLDELTWMEVDEALAEGFTRVIIPTGGTEQNGPHVTLGKHNRIIRYTAEEISKREGRMLVAPVMAYVPEGDISPKSGHMAYAGTLTVRPEIFTQVLEDTANSLFAHGFTHVYILGDSGGSVDAQEAATVNVRAGLTDSQQITHLTDYYSANQQFATLQKQGFTDDAIGFHAGIRDTSELMAVSPSDVREDALRRTDQNKGATGAFWRADSEIGEMMLELKIKAARQQIQRGDSVEETGPAVALSLK